jgi:hypothetical protein
MICTLTLHILLPAESDAYYYNYVMYIYILMLDVLIITYLNCVHDEHSYSADIIALRSSSL